jgi:hypothetical protein
MTGEPLLSVPTLQKSPSAGACWLCRHKITGKLTQQIRDSGAVRRGGIFPEKSGELNGSLQHIYSKRLDKGWCVCRDQDLLDFPLSKGSRHGVAGSPATA